jgi:hypothetical protein
MRGVHLWVKVKNEQKREEEKITEFTGSSFRKDFFWSHFATFFGLHIFNSTGGI